MRTITERSQWGVLSGNALKVFAAAAMLTDHVGFLFFPQVQMLRIIGRLAFPIFAFMIAEGCRYTRSRLRYFLSLLVLGAVCQIVYTIAGDGGRMNILITFSMSVGLICILQEAKSGKWALWPLFVLCAGGAFLFCSTVGTDYGFFGVMTPVLSSLFQSRRGATPSSMDRNSIHVGMLGVGLLLLSFSLGGIQCYALLALPLLLLYSGRRGKWNLKYFFYLFYPLHLAALQVIAWITG